MPAVIRCIGEDAQSIAVQSIAVHRAPEGQGMFLWIKIKCFFVLFIVFIIYILT